jgi:phage recombination protein Bet
MTTTALDTPVDLAAPLAVKDIDAERFKLVKETVAQKASSAEVAMFLELATKYHLDPFAKEIWCAKSAGRDGGEGRLLIMVGRDGLRKIAQRNGIHIDGDVVRQNDEMTVVRTPNGDRTVAHSYTPTGDRGDIIGAWAECREGGPLGRPLGYFYAPLEEYRPTNENKLKHSPWGAQVSVMILAAAERQALRQATPLSGLLVGYSADVPGSEADLNLEIARGEQFEQGDLDEAISANVPATLQGRAAELIDEMNSLAPNSWSASKIEMTFKLKGPEGATVELGHIERAIEELRASGVEPVIEGDAVEDDGEVREARIAKLKDALENGSLSEQMRGDAEAELDLLEGERRAEVGEGQGELPV